MMKKLTLLFILTIACSQLGVFADSSYSVQSLPTPAGIVCEVTGLDYSEDGTLYICTRRGDVWAQKNGDWNRFAHGLHEPMGLLAGPGFAVISQRPEVTRLVDEDGDGTADRYETICDQIAMEANFHQYNYGLVKGKIAGNLHGILSCSGLSKPDGSPASANGFSPIPYRMWSYQISPSGEFRPWSSGLRTANGIGKSPQGELFAADNQGDWVATSMLHHLEEGDFHGHPAALRWDQNFPYSQDPKSSPIDLLEKMRKPPAVHFPHGELANSPGSPAWDTTGGKFGPFAGQIFIGDIVHPRIIRVALEKVNGQYQGACFSFYHAEGLKAGICRLAFSSEGELIIGRAGEGNWARGKPDSGLQKIAYSGTTPFEIHRIELQNDGFLFHFTQPINQSIKLDPEKFGVQSYHYPYGPNYGYPKTDNQKIVPTRVEQSLDGSTIRVMIPNLEERKIYQFNLPELKDPDGKSLRNPVAYYTLNELLEN
ncbi:hypothetical protein N9N55_07635 [Opitutales bacterium]|nr:hypothetical protein [Opitutales bacterium]